MAASQHDPESYNRIFILGAKNCTEETLRETFEKFGTVKDVYFVKDRYTDERKGRLPVPAEHITHRACSLAW